MPGTSVRLLGRLLLGLAGAAAFLAVSATARSMPRPSASELTSIVPSRNPLARAFAQNEPALMPPPPSGPPTIEDLICPGLHAHELALTGYSGRVRTTSASYSCNFTISREDLHDLHMEFETFGLDPAGEATFVVFSGLVASTDPADIIYEFNPKSGLTAPMGRLDLRTSAIYVEYHSPQKSLNDTGFSLRFTALPTYCDTTRPCREGYFCDTSGGTTPIGLAALAEAGVSVNPTLPGDDPGVCRLISEDDFLFDCFTPAGGAPPEQGHSGSGHGEVDVLRGASPPVLTEGRTSASAGRIFTSRTLPPNSFCSLTIEPPFYHGAVEVIVRTTELQQSDIILFSNHLGRQINYAVMSANTETFYVNAKALTINFHGRSNRTVSELEISYRFMEPVACDSIYACFAGVVSDWYCSDAGTCQCSAGATGCRSSFFILEPTPLTLVDFLIFIIPLSVILLMIMALVIWICLRKRKTDSEDAASLMDGGPNGQATHVDAIHPLVTAEYIASIATTANRFSSPLFGEEETFHGKFGGSSYSGADQDLRFDDNDDYFDEDEGTYLGPTAVAAAAAATAATTTGGGGAGSRPAGASGGLAGGVPGGGASRSRRGTLRTPALPEDVPAELPLSQQEYDIMRPLVHHFQPYDWLELAEETDPVGRSQLLEGIAKRIEQQALANSQNISRQAAAAAAAGVGPHPSAGTAAEPLLPGTADPYQPF
ncbi:hypothetical protein H696_01514 [Fonticula alba]|uniref:Uncharacterized protein n=1 Tax=Fonticula alba TaxID=691883 RepID=A0A058ZDV7_FONAL|nr:hypothetical protein H696_01514 [Fonticula alba]KCV72108.1 hypothetical protein H696_01514 [Fonticula alba]|eukprot:XP_009493686.1 hypothetical protein H696_01514 [Fonticula alba]